MKKTERLKKNSDFQVVYKTGKSKGNKYFVMYVVKNGLDVNKLGVSVSKKVGNSVVRHRIKRLVKESYRLHEDMFNSGLNIVIVARNSSKDIDFKTAESAIIHLFGLHKAVI